MSFKPVPVHKGSFAFCRYGLAALSWSAFFMQSRAVVIVAGALMLLSAILKVRRAPLIALFDATFEKLRPSPVELLDENAMRFAHTFGFVLFGIDAALLSFHATILAGWIFLVLISIAKTVGALGFCAASKMYTCATSGGGKCCAFWQRGK
jgi:hypothetical protein